MVFSNKKDFQQFINSKALYEIDSGSEGNFFVSAQDRKGYKIFYNPDDYLIPLYDGSEIIMNDDIKIDSFIFPQELLIVNNQVKGYVTKYISGNIISDDNIMILDPEKFDFKAFKEAYKVMKIDMELLSQKGVFAYDVSSNVIYNGKKLYAVDTLGYRKSTSKYLLKENMTSLDLAIDTIIEIILLQYPYELKARGNMKITDYIDYLEKQISKNCKKYGFIKY